MHEASNYRVVVIEHGGPEVLQVVNETLPVHGPGEVRARVLAAGVSAFDLIYRRWAHLPGGPKVPFALGEDVVGLVDQSGAGATRFAEGQMVAGGTWALGVGGGYSEYLCLPETELVAVPAGVDPAEAVCSSSTTSLPTKLRVLFDNCCSKHLQPNCSTTLPNDE